MFSRRGLLAVLGVAAVLASVFGWPQSAGAIHEVVIEITATEGEPFSTVPIATEEVEPWLQAESCAIEIEVANNASVHEGTDLVLTSGDDTVTVSDVETEPGIVTVREGELVLGETVVVALRLGADGISSGGVRVTFLCPDEPPTTTTPTAPATTTTTPATITTAPATTTSTVAPIATTTTVVPPTTAPRVEGSDVEMPPSQPETPTAAQPSFTG